MATGKGAFFRLDNPTTLTDISAWIRTVTPANENEEVDGTVITSQKREFEPTFERDRLTLSLKWSPASLAFCNAIKGQTGLDYEYGVNGNGAGKPKITGTCNVLRAQTMGGADPNTLTTLEIELNINTEVHGTF